VNGTGIPDVNFDVGESYAGLMPISKAANESSQLYFWFYPSTNPLADDEILIWLNGGVSFIPRLLFTIVCVANVQ
jgi:carboxypeptidase D